MKMLLLPGEKTPRLIVFHTGHLTIRYHHDAFPMITIMPRYCDIQYITIHFSTILHSICVTEENHAFTEKQIASPVSC